MNSEHRNQVLRASREYAEATLRDCGLTLSDIVALYDTDELDARLPLLTDGTCGWYRGYGLIRNIGDLICQECFSITMEMIRAIVTGDTETYAVWERKVNSRHTSGTIQ
jgi:hypothetical protein